MGMEANKINVDGSKTKSLFWNWNFDQSSLFIESDVCAQHTYI